MKNKISVFMVSAMFAISAMCSGVSDNVEEFDKVLENEIDKKASFANSKFSQSDKDDVSSNHVLQDDRKPE